MFLLADTGICIAPSLDQKMGLAKSAVEIARALGLTCPAVALMAATEKVHPQMPETLDVEEIQRRAAAGELGSAGSPGHCRSTWPTPWRRDDGRSSKVTCWGPPMCCCSRTCCRRI